MDREGRDAYNKVIITITEEQCSFPHIVYIYIFLPSPPTSTNH